MDYYFDEQLPPSIAEALDRIESHEGKNRVRSTTSAFGKGISDADLFRRLKEVGGILVTHDLKMMTRKREFGLIRELGLSAFLISLPNGANYETIWQTVVLRWVAIKKEQHKHRHAPFVCRIKMKGKPELLD